MTRIDPVYLEHQLKRWMAPNAHLFVRPDWRRFVRPEDQKSHPFALYERKYSPEQPRVPAGSREGGQWTSEGGDGPARAASEEGVIGAERPALVQFRTDERSVSSERLIQLGGEYIGSFDNGISVIKGPNITHQESFNANTGVTTLTFTGVGSVVVDERTGVYLTGSTYSVGTRGRPDQGLSIMIDRSGRVRAYTTLGA